MKTEPIPQGCLPFDLEKALAGHPVRARNGEAVTELHHFKSCGKDTESVVGVIEGILETFSERGIYLHNTLSPLDIFLVKPEPKKVKVWIPVSRKPMAMASHAHNTDYAFLNKERCTAIDFDPKYWQIIEAEIEVAE